MNRNNSFFILNNIVLFTVQTTTILFFFGLRKNIYIIIFYFETALANKSVPSQHSRIWSSSFVWMLLHIARVACIGRKINTTDHNRIMFHHPCIFKSVEENNLLLSFLYHRLLRWSSELKDNYGISLDTSLSEFRS